jgi:hypothetical protein
MEKMLAMVAVAVVFTSLKPLQAETWSPDMQTIQKLEASLQPGDLPSRSHAAGDLSVYARYYAGFTENGHKMIAGEFLRAPFGKGAAGVHVVQSRKDFPLIMDGGCGVINFVYDTDTGKMLAANCNGMG